MRDLYKKSNFPTRFDIFGEENYVKETKYDKKFNIELLFGRPVDRTMGASRIIFTEELKTFILANKKIPNKEFTGVLRSCMVSLFRRILKANPYKSYKAWLESDDIEKPKEITLLDVKNNPEYIQDYFGTVYILFSAIRMDDGAVFPMGVPRDTYGTNSKKTKRFIFTSLLVERIKEYRFYPHKGMHLFPFGELTYTKLKKELGYTETTKESINKWLAAHLDKIMTMTNEEFTKQYASRVHITQNSIACVKTSSHHLMQMKKNNGEREKEIFKLFRMYRKKRDKAVRKQIIKYIGETRCRDDFRAYHVLKLARELGHTIPKGMKNIR